MTVTSQSNKINYAGNGVTTVFSFSFIGVAINDIVVTVTTAAGVSTVIPSNQYTVDLTPAVSGQPYGLGGTVTYPLSGAALAAGNTLTIARIVPLTQDTSFGNQGAFYPTAVEQALDYLMISLQQVSERQGRAISIPIVDPNAPLDLPPAAQRALKGLIFDANGDPTAGVLSSVANISAAMIPVVTAATLAAARAAMGIGGTTIYPGGRTSLDPNNPVSEADITGASHVYLAFADSDQTTIYDGTSWVQYQYTAVLDLLLNNPAHAANTNYYFMEYVAAGAPACGSSPAWTSNTNPGAGAGTAELETFQGRLVNKNAMTIRNGAATVSVPARRANMRGWFRTTGTPGQTSDSGSFRLVGDLLRPVPRPLIVVDPSNSWAYTTVAYRQANGNAANQVVWFHGLGGRIVDLTSSSFAASTNASVQVLGTGIGIDTVTAQSAQVYDDIGSSNAYNQFGAYARSRYVGYPGIGYHVGAWLEYGGLNATFYGDNGTTTKQTGLIGHTFQ